ncbi:hypothetical protein [Spirosoma endophyticum]|uniref:Uncharacterized protein n=1 Tax=Spirosoma endophyticum TaxID=662367 RepID=A0A1I2ICS5_9BACT|nr:hypothetical protein [Spirosoma endophyticum]SFF39420.1 hypothetical protein SAMN05216167_1642 [Spirosoma endophyticum]
MIFFKSSFAFSTKSISFLLISVLVYACHGLEPNDIGANGARSLAITDPFNYTETNLKKLGKGVILAASEDSSFRNLIYAEIEKKFDGDYNVLIKTLNQKSTALNINLREKILQANENPSDDNALIAFDNIEGKSYNPQVFIPFYQELKKEGKIGIGNPVLVVFNGKVKKDNLEEAYILNKNQVSKATFLVDEEYAKTHEVWVLAINDRTGGDLDKKINQPKNTPVADKGARAATAYDYAYITGVGISQNKESWASGDNDVYFTCIYTSGPPSTNLPDYTTDYVDDWSVNELGLFKEFNFTLKEIATTTSGVSLFGGYNSSGAFGTKYHAFVLYEHDNFPAVYNTAHITIDGYTSELEYRSAESSYMEDFTDATPHLVNIHSVYYYDKSNGASRVRTGVSHYN